MIIDSHCHAWDRWPYKPPVPDDRSRGTIEQLLNEMDLNGVDQAVIICAQIERNAKNNEYVAAHASRHMDRIHLFPDIDSSWSPTYHEPEATERLRQIADRWPTIKGFTHYLKAEDDGAWLYSPEGIAFFRFAAERKLIASIALRPQQHPALRRMAEQIPTMPILCHHLAGLRASDKGGTALREVLESAKLPNIYLKFSGFAYCSRVNWDFPYTDTHEIIRPLYDTFGAKRMCWGSDYPVVRFFMTYKHSLEALRTHCRFISETDKKQILGDTLSELLRSAGNRNPSGL
jgi:predicted TIM-barrel fold metal-dependent hydrolase